MESLYLTILSISTQVHDNLSSTFLLLLRFYMFISQSENRIGGGGEWGMAESEGWQSERQADFPLSKELDAGGHDP